MCENVIDIQEYIYVLMALTISFDVIESSIFSVIWMVLGVALSIGSKSGKNNISESEI